MIRDYGWMQVKRKGKFGLAHTMKAYGGEEQFHTFLASAVAGAEWSASRPGRCLPGETDPDTGVKYGSNLFNFLKEQF